MKEMVKELKEFCVEIYGYDPLLSREEIKGFGVKALDNLYVKLKMDGVIVAVAHDEFKRFSFSTGLVFFCKKKKCVYAYKFKGKRYDAGDKLGYKKAIIDFTLERTDLREEIEKYLREAVAASLQSFKVK